MWDGTQVTHQLRGAFGDEGPLFAEALGIGDAVIDVVRGAQAGALVRMGHPCLLYTSQGHGTLHERYSRRI